MLNGTKRLFPNDYKDFVESMVEAADEEELPVMLQLDDLKDYTLKDIQDMFFEFNRDTALEITGHLFLCDDCGKLHLLIKVDYPGEDGEERILQ